MKCLVSKFSSVNSTCSVILNWSLEAPNKEILVFKGCVFKGKDSWSRIRRGLLEDSNQRVVEIHIFF